MARTRGDPLAMTAALREAYAACIAEAAADVFVPKVASDRSVSAAWSEAELDWARLLSVVGLPHLGEQVAIEARLHNDGVAFR